MESLLTTGQVADRLQVHEETVRRYVRSGELAAIRKGRLIRIAPQAVEEFLEPGHTASSWTKAAERMKGVYAASLVEGGELTVSTAAGGGYAPTPTDEAPTQEGDAN